MSLGGAEQAALPSAPALFVSLPAGTRAAAFPLLCSQLKAVRQRHADASSHQETKGAAPPNLPLLLMTDHCRRLKKAAPPVEAV